MFNFFPKTPGWLEIAKIDFSRKLIIEFWKFQCIWNLYIIYECFSQELEMGPLFKYQIWIYTLCSPIVNWDRMSHLTKATHYTEVTRSLLPQCQSSRFWRRTKDSTGNRFELFKPQGARWLGCHIHRRRGCRIEVDNQPQYDDWWQSLVNLKKKK